MSKNLILGDGLLGMALHVKTGWDFISRKKDGVNFIDISSYQTLLSDYDTIINCIANTNTYSEDRDDHWNVNFKGVADLVDACNSLNKKLVHISTDYIYSNSTENASESDVPCHCANWYGYTKLLGDGYVQLRSKNFLLIRTTHKNDIFKHEYAYVNQIGNFDDVSTISELIIKVIDKNGTGIFNIGTDIKTMYDLAIRSNPQVKPTDKLFHGTMPCDISMNVSKLKKFLSS